MIVEGPFRKLESRLRGAIESGVFFLDVSALYEIMWLNPLAVYAF